ncbi:hypothetical protein AB0C93_37860 [Streptomyces sp. NPDC048518]|uniref:hypothetical protein n=1 Tax=Streptomyces sp. NPDC048518 TaxID=3155029 RepID=UPI0033E60DF5
MSSSSEPWWNAQDSDADDRRQEESEVLAEAAADLRDAAEMMRDASAPPVPDKESSWDFSWLTEMGKRGANGWAFTRALWSTGPAWTVFLATQGFEFWTATGITFLGFIVIGGMHLRAERKTTRLLTWGLPVGLAYYAPVAIVFGLGKVLVGG